MKKLFTVLAVVLFSVSMISCEKETVTDEEITYATGKDCDGSPGDKDCEDN